MDNVNESVITVIEERSYIKSFTLGVSLAFKNLGMLLRYIWPSALLAILLPLPCYVLFEGQNVAVLRKLMELGYLPKVSIKGLRADIARCSKRAVFNLIISVILNMLMCVTIMLPFITGHRIEWGLLGSFILFLLLLPIDFVCMEISFSDKPLSQCLRGFGRGYRNYGSMFAFTLLCFIFLMLVSFVGLMPLIVLLEASNQAISAYKLGDVLDLPTLFPMYVFLAYAIGSLFVYIGIQVLYFCRCMMWGSLVKEVPADTEVDG